MRMPGGAAVTREGDRIDQLNREEPEGTLVAYRSRRRDMTRRFLANRLAVVGLVLAVALATVAVFAPLISPHDPTAQFEGGISLIGLPLGPNGHFLLGTDTLGRDMESRLIYGARISLLIGTLANGLAVAIGVTLGAIGGFFGRIAETVVMRLTDVMMAFPLILLLIALAVVLQPSVGIIIIVIALGGWPGTARLIYGEVVALKEQEFIQAARAVGASNMGILVRHILPHLYAPIIVWTMLGIAPAITTESVLSFLGVGVQPPTPSWGNMIGEGQANYLSAPWLVLWPGIALMLTVISFNLVVDGLRDVLDVNQGPRG
jgi:peptide/nickel transport system permease protein